MENPDAPALRPDGSLKDASEMEWEYSPSSKTIPLPDPADAAGSSTSHGNVNPGPPKGLRGKEPANVVAGKRVSKPTIKVSASANQRLSPRTRCF